VTVCPERFFKTLKRKEVYLHDYRTFEEAEAFRRHGALGIDVPKRAPPAPTVSRDQAS
jgi:hypothetical protein